MENDIYEQTYALKEALKKDSRLIRVNQCEEKMNDSDEVMALAYQKDLAASHYAELLNIYPEDSEEIRSARLALQKTKVALESYPLVRDYLKAYAEVRDLYFMMNDKLFSFIYPHLCPQGEK
ncbi:MAG: YlbF family regulator [Erysipelotrichaceae bacterium]|nr:YlbF family regulator [Erysipelotrichaceae bacterium]